MIKCLLNTNSLHKIFFSQNFVSEKLVRKILTNIIIFFLNQTMKKVVQTRRRRVQQSEKLLLLGAHRELPGSSSQLRVRRDFFQRRRHLKLNINSFIALAANFDIFDVVKSLVLKTCLRVFPTQRPGTADTSLTPCGVGYFFCVVCCVVSLIADMSY
jgi:hypothetical protein